MQPFFPFRLLAFGSALLILAIAGCKDPDSKRNDIEQAGKVKQRRIPYGKGTLEKEAYQQADYRILFIGNSHTSTCLMPKTVQQMLNARLPDKKVFCEICASSFLVDHLNRKRTTDLIQNGDWDLVVLQAQKYSMSGTVDYPYDAALQLTKMANAQGAEVLMYPEWGRRTNSSQQQLDACLAEAVRIQKLHEKIVKESGASVVPVGLVWNQALQSNPDRKLHSDGNHANEAGAFLTAAVFDQWIAREHFKLGTDALNQPFAESDEYNISRKSQKELAEIARKFVNEWPKSE